MKHRSFWNRRFWLAFSVLIFAASPGPMRVIAQPTQTYEGVTPPPSAKARVSSETSETATADTDAPATMVSVEKPLPHNLNPRGPLAEIVKLANSGVNESVMLAFVTNSVHTFNLGAEDIIYLNDIGVPAAVVTAMMQRDQDLKGAFASTPVPPPPSPEPARRANGAPEFPPYQFAVAVPAHEGVQHAWKQPSISSYPCIGGDFLRLRWEPSEPTHTCQAAGRKLRGSR